MVIRIRGIFHVNLPDNPHAGFAVRRRWGKSSKGLEDPFFIFLGLKIRGMSQLLLEFIDTRPRYFLHLFFLKISVKSTCLACKKLSGARFCRSSKETIPFL